MEHVSFWWDTLLSTGRIKSNEETSNEEEQTWLCWCLNKDILFLVCCFLLAASIYGLSRENRENLNIRCMRKWFWIKQAARKPRNSCSPDYVCDMKNCEIYSGEARKGGLTSRSQWLAIALTMRHIPLNGELMSHYWSSITDNSTIVQCSFWSRSIIFVVAVKNIFIQSRIPDQKEIFLQKLNLRSFKFPGVGYKIS